MKIFVNIKSERETRDQLSTIGVLMIALNVMCTDNLLVWGPIVPRYDVSLANIP